LIRYSQGHQDRLVAHLTSTSPQFQAQAQALAARFVSFGSDPIGAATQALALIQRQVEEQAMMLSYLDVFRLLIRGCFVAAALTLFLSKIDLNKTQAAG